MSKSGRIYEENRGLYLQRNLLEIQNQWWNTWVDTRIKSLLAIIESKA